MQSKDIESISFAQAVDAMCSVHERLADARAELIAEWDYETPPTVGVFDVFAWATVELLREADPAVEHLFQLVEMLLLRGDPQVVECVSTGFVETLVNTPIEPVLWREKLGPRARLAAESWEEFWAPRS